MKPVLLHKHYTYSWVQMFVDIPLKSLMSYRSFSCTCTRLIAYYTEWYSCHSYAILLYCVTNKWFSLVLYIPKNLELVAIGRQATFCFRFFCLSLMSYCKPNLVSQSKFAIFPQPCVTCSMHTYTVFSRTSSGNTECKYMFINFHFRSISYVLHVSILKICTVQLLMACTIYMTCKLECDHVLLGW